MEFHGRLDWQESWHQPRDPRLEVAFHVPRLLSDRQYGFNEMQRSIDGDGDDALAATERATVSRLVEKQVEPTTPPLDDVRTDRKRRGIRRTLEEMEEMIVFRRSALTGARV